jgi:hypothetical protein
MKSFLHIWTIPFILGLISAFGLLAALNGEGFWDAMSWLALAIPLVVGSYFLYTAFKRADK